MSTAVQTAPPRRREPLPQRTAALSPSRAADFMACPLLYRFRVIDRLPSLPSHRSASAIDQPLRVAYSSTWS